MNQLCRLGLGLLLSLAAQLGVAQPQAQQPVFDIVAAPLGEALTAFAQQSGLQVILDARQAEGVQSPGVSGAYSAQAAIEKLLERTPFRAEWLDGHTVAIRLAAKHGEEAAAADAAAGAGADSRAIELPADTARAGVLHLAQADVAGSPSDEPSTEDMAALLEEVIVTGSRLSRPRADGLQHVKVYDRERIERSGQGSVTAFLNTLPEVSVSLQDNASSRNFIDSTVNLHGLPLGTTLVLLNGRRVQGSGSATAGSGENFVNLNTLPLAAVERIEVLAEGSSAVYGSDAIAGVINIILRKDFDGLELNAGYGSASGMDEWNAAVAWGKRWDRGAVSILGTLQDNGELTGLERSITANADRSAQGGIDARLNECNPGNVFSVDGSPLPGAPPGVDGSFAAVSPTAGGNPSLDDFIYGTLNKCNFLAYQSLVPPRDLQGVLLQANADLGAASELFAELLYSHSEIKHGQSPDSLFGVPGFQLFTVPAANPFNPFGQTVGISYLLTDLGRFKYSQDTDFLRALLGVRGALPGGWQWEAAGLWSGDQSDFGVPFQDFAAIQAALDSADPATALNPFGTGPAGSAQTLETLSLAGTNDFESRTFGVNGFVRGRAYDLPAGPLELVIGADVARFEIDSGGLHVDGQPLSPPTPNDRDVYSAFAEARLPLLARADSHEGDVLALALAGRHDHYSDFGGKTTPQIGAQWRPLESLSVRGTYARSFKAPTLPELLTPQFSFPSFVSDPANGGQFVPVDVLTGGNENLDPESGESRVLGVSYSSRVVPGLQLSVTHWEIDLENNIQVLDSQEIVDHEALFPERITRDPLSGLITAVDSTFINFGRIEVAGVDYRADHRIQTGKGEWSPSLSVTQTYRYAAAFVPGVAPVDAANKAQGNGNWAPRWKGNVGLGWRGGLYSASLTGRYLGSYQDYDSVHEIGDFWIFDADFRYTRGKTWIAVGGVNLFDESPQLSNFSSGFVGYDVMQADIRGRFAYARVGFGW